MTVGLAKEGESGAAPNSVNRDARRDRSVAPADRGFRWPPNPFQAALALFRMATGGSARADSGVEGERDPLADLATRRFTPPVPAPTAGRGGRARPAQLRRWRLP
ncbi:hypothetical protein [Thermaurantiacus sp.]